MSCGVWWNYLLNCPHDSKETKIGRFTLFLGQNHKNGRNSMKNAWIQKRFGTFSYHMGTINLRYHSPKNKFLTGIVCLIFCASDC